MPILNTPIQDSIRAYLLTLSAVTDIVGSTKIRPELAEQADTPPWITISVPRIEHGNDLQGIAGRAKATVEIRCVSETSTEAANMIDDHRINDTNPGTGLAGYSGVAGSHTIDAHIVDTESGFTAASDGTERDLYYTLSTYVIEYNETT